MIITIDGPVASGKSSVAKALAKEMGFYYLYTGLLYRAVAYLLLERLQKESGGEVSKQRFEVFVQSLTPQDLTFVANLYYDYEEDRPCVFYQEAGTSAAARDITKQLSHVSIDQLASLVSTNKYVRTQLLDLQQNVAKKYDMVADGRDCGTVVFPNAEYKFYLTADVQVRAERLMLDEKRGTQERNLEKVKAEVEERDKRDKERDVAPLTIPQGAIIVDNSTLTQEETLNKFLACIHKK